MFKNIEMNTSIIKRLKKIEIRLNEVLDADLFNISEAAFDELQSEVSCFEQDLNELLEFHGEHLQFSELKKISSIQKKIRQVKKGNVFFDPELERSIMFPNRKDEEEDDFAL